MAITSASNAQTTPTDFEKKPLTSLNSSRSTPPTPLLPGLPFDAPSTLNFNKPEGGGVHSRFLRSLLFTGKLISSKFAINIETGYGQDFHLALIHQDNLCLCISHIRSSS